MTFEERANAFASALEAKGGENVKVYDVRGVSGLADAFIVASGAAAPHLKALASAAEDAARAMDGSKAYRISGDASSGWMAVDFIDIVVHIFSPEARAYYALEKLWQPRSSDS